MDKPILIKFIKLSEALDKLTTVDKPMLVDYMELRAALEKLAMAEETIKQLLIELSEARHIARDMVACAKDVQKERERAARICETLELTLPNPKHYSINELYIMKVTESGCRGAFAQAIRGGETR